MAAIEACARTSATPARQPRRQPWWMLPLALYALSRVIDTMLLLHLVPEQYAHFAPSAGYVPLASDPPSYAHLLVNWDGQWYQQIAEHGYPGHLPEAQGAVAQNAWAFYPLLPLLARAVMVLGLPFPVAASIVTTLCAGAAACVLHRTVQRRSSTFTASMAVLGLFFAPAAPLFQCAYADSIALLLVLLALDALGRQRYGAVVAWCLLLAFTRPIALPLSAVVTVHGVLRWRRRDEQPFAARDAWQVGRAAMACAASFLIWPLVAALVTGRVDAYLATQHAWDRPQMGGSASWLVQTLQHRTLGVMGFTMAVLVLLASLALRRGAERWGPELRSWMLLYPVYVLGATVPRSSVIRHLLLAVCPWWPVPDVSERVRSRRGRIALVLTLVLVGTALQQLWLRSFYVIGPSYVSYP